MKEYKKEIIVLSVCFILCVISFSYIKNKFYSNANIDAPVNRVVSSIKNEREINYNNEIRYKEAVTQQMSETTTIKTVMTSISNQEDEVVEYTDDSSYPYQIAPAYVDDGSIIYEGMTLTELTDKLNKSLNGYLTNTGYFFADYTKKTGLDPYLAVSIVLLETGCKWTCSSITRECNNIGGLKGGPSCDGKSYKKYNTLGEGIDGFLDIIYNKYYLNGMKTPEEMAHIYAASSEWSNKVRTYMNEIKAA